MKRMLFLLLGLGVLGAAPADIRPNLVVIMADDLDPRTLQTMLDAGMLPNFDATFVRGGVRFPNCFASNPICAPSRATFLTGQYSHNHGVHHNAPWGGGVNALDHSSTIATW